MAKYNFYATTIRNGKNSESPYMLYGLQNGDNYASVFKSFYKLAYVILGMIILLLFLLAYLVWLRNRRIRAEKWLQEHQQEIVSYAMFKKTEEMYQDENAVNTPSDMVN